MPPIILRAGTGRIKAFDRPPCPIGPERMIRIGSKVARLLRIRPRPGRCPDIGETDIGAAGGILPGRAITPSPRPGPGAYGTNPPVPPRGRKLEAGGANQLPGANRGSLMNPPGENPWAWASPASPKKATQSEKQRFMAVGSPRRSGWNPAPGETG